MNTAATLAERTRAYLSTERSGESPSHRSGPASIATAPTAANVDEVACGRMSVRGTCNCRVRRPRNDASAASRQTAFRVISAGLLAAMLLFSSAALAVRSSFLKTVKAPEVVGQF